MSTIEKSLELACERIADSPQSYEEAKTARDWYQEFIRRAKLLPPDNLRPLVKTGGFSFEQCKPFMSKKPLRRPARQGRLSE